jgi:hypothetical protein
MELGLGGCMCYPYHFWARWLGLAMWLLAVGMIPMVIIAILSAKDSPPARMNPQTGQPIVARRTNAPPQGSPLPAATLPLGFIGVMALRAGSALWMTLREFTATRVMSYLFLGVGALGFALAVVVGVVGFDPSRQSSPRSSPVLVALTLGGLALLWAGWATWLVRWSGTAGED